MVEPPLVHLLLIQQRLTARLGDIKSPLAAALDPVHGLIGPGQGAAEIVLWPDGRYPHAQPHDRLAIGQLERGGDGLDAAVCQLAGAGTLALPGQQQHELAPPEPAQPDVVAAAGAQALADGYQQLVAGAVAQVVIHLLEVIQIDEADGPVLPGELAVQGGAIEQAGEGIPVGELGQLLLVLLLVGDVDVGPHHPDRVAPVIPLHHPAPVQHPGDLAILGEHAVHHLIEGALALQVIEEGLQHPLPVFRVQVGTPHIEVGRQLLGLVAQHGAPAPVEDDELAGGDVVLPDAQAGAVHGGIQLLTGILGHPLQALILLQQPVIGLPQLFICHP